MKSSGYPTTLCGKGTFNEQGCNLCCKGQVVETTASNWKKISNTLSPNVLELATRRSVQRLETTIPTITSTIINSHPNALKSHAQDFLKFPDRFSSIIPFNGTIIDLIFENQSSFNSGQPFSSFEALSNTGYFQEQKTALQGPTSETTINLSYLLMTSVSNHMSDRGYPLTKEEIIEEITFMLQDGNNAKDYPCPLLNTRSGKCEIYENRPEVCRIAGNYCPNYVEVSGCGANFMYSTLNGNREPLYPKKTEIFSEEMFNIDVLPIEFFLVKELASKNKEFAQNPTSFFPKPNKRKRH